jgi:hypothetical protein
MMADIFQQLLGPRPSLTIDIEQGFVTGLWVAGRRPDLIIRTSISARPSFRSTGTCRPGGSASRSPRHTCFHSEDHPMSQRGASIRGPPGGCQPIVNPAPYNVQQARRVQAGARLRKPGAGICASTKS